MLVPLRLRRLAGVSTGRHATVSRCFLHKRGIRWVVGRWGRGKGVIYISRSSSSAPTGPTSRPSVPSLSSFSSLSCGSGVNPRPVRFSRITKCGALVMSKLAAQLQASRRRSWRAAVKSGHFRSVCSEVRSPPHLHLSGGFPGHGCACLEPEQYPE